jgi:LemA protein
MTAGMFDFDAKPNFSVQNEEQISKPPSVDFNNSTPAQQAAPVESAPKPAGN